MRIYAFGFIAFYGDFCLKFTLHEWRDLIYDRKVNRMARPDKAAAVAELTEDFRTATATVLTEYRGLSVTLMKKLRRNLGSDTKYSVVKNTLTKIAAKEAGFDVPAELLTGPSALAFIKGDAIVAAKSLRDFAKRIHSLLSRVEFTKARTSPQPKFTS